MSRSRRTSRRQFLARAGGSVVGANVWGRVREVAAKIPQAPDHTLTVISGSPRERGRQYGRIFKDGIHAFLDREIFQAFAGKAASREQMLRFAGGCAKAIQQFSPLINDELAGMAEGAGLKLEEIVLITLHEELVKGGKLPAINHCTAMAIGPPYTKGDSFVGQTWDWMGTVYGLSSMLLWKRSEGPSVLAYAYPGLWTGAGLNRAGIALCWTSAFDGKKDPRVGIPSYVLIAQMLYQETLQAALDEARRAKQAGWFTFVLADGNGNLANVEGSPTELVIEKHQGRVVRQLYGSAAMTRTSPAKEYRVGNKCVTRMRAMLEETKGATDVTRARRILDDPGICIPVRPERHEFTLDAMLFNTTERIAWVRRGPGTDGRWNEFRFPK